MPSSMTALCKFYKATKSVLQSKDRTVNENKMSSHFISTGSYRSGPSMLLFDSVVYKKQVRTLHETCNITSRFCVRNHTYKKT